MPNQTDNNPYVSPVTVEDQSNATRRSFRVGVQEVHTVVVETSLWSGLRTHTTNEVGTSTPVVRGNCEFEIGEHERHVIKVAVDGTGRMSLSVDGAVVERNMFPKRRVTILCITVAAVLLLAGAALSLAFGLI